jgi:hypothetical protein
MSDLSNDTKKHTMKSRETIPLSQGGYFFCLFMTYGAFKITLISK